MKVINIIHYPTNYNLSRGNIKPVVEWMTKNGETCAIWNGNWAQLLCNELIKADTENEYEIWRPDIRADKLYTYKYENGLIYKLFPARYRNCFYGLRREKIAFSEEMCLSLEENIKTTKEIILHLNAAYRQHDNILARKFYKKLSIIGQFYTNPLLLFEKSTTVNPVKMIHRMIIESQIKGYYKKVRNIIPSIHEGMDLYKSKYGLKIYERQGCANYGIDFSFWDVDITKSNARAQLGIPQDETVLFSSSRLVPEKQIDLMIRELGLLKGRKFKVYVSGNGSKEYADYLKNTVIESGLAERVIFLGFIPEEQLILYYKACDIFISTSRSEAGPLSTALAALYEKPIITTNTGLVYDLLVTEKAACYIDRECSNSWHLSFQRALDGVSIPICSKVKIKEYFDWRNISDYYIKTYASVLKK